VKGVVRGAVGGFVEPLDGVEAGGEVVALGAGFGEDRGVVGGDVEGAALAVDAAVDGEAVGAAVV
jgi:hypothetical protein